MADLNKITPLEIFRLEESDLCLWLFSLHLSIISVNCTDISYTSSEKILTCNVERDEEKLFLIQRPREHLLVVQECPQEPARRRLLHSSARLETDHTLLDSELWW